MPLMVAYLVIALVGQIGGTVWMLYGSDRYGWSPAMLGLSMTGFGLFHALSQAFLAGSLVERWGERRTMVLGIVADCGAYMLIAFASRSWMALALLPLLGVGGVGVPALRSLLSRCVDDQHQGRLQGVLASLVSLAAIIGPPATSAVYFATHHLKFGAVWIIGGSLYIFCLPALVRGKDDRSRR